MEKTGSVAESQNRSSALAVLKRGVGLSLSPPPLRDTYSPLLHTQTQTRTTMWEQTGRCLRTTRASSQVSEESARWRKWRKSEETGEDQTEGDTETDKDVWLSCCFPPDRSLTELRSHGGTDHARAGEGEVYGTLTTLILFNLSIVGGGFTLFVDSSQFFFSCCLPIHRYFDNSFQWGWKSKILRKSEKLNERF